MFQEKIRQLIALIPQNPIQSTVTHPEPRGSHVPSLKPQNTKNTPKLNALKKKPKHERQKPQKSEQPKLKTKQELIKESVNQKFQVIDVLTDKHRKPENLMDKLLAKTRGEKVLEDPKLIAKTMKRKEKKKVKSTQAWEQRKEELLTQKRQRDEKRRDNIQKRQEKVKEGRVAKKQGKKLKKPKKKGF
jgi:hypothetical protein